MQSDIETLKGKKEKSNSPWEKQRKVGDPNCSLKDDCVFIAAKISLSLL